MADIENLVLEHLKAIQGTLLELRADGRETRIRMSHLEEQSGALFVQYASLSSRIDRLTESASRINQRLELTE